MTESFIIFELSQKFTMQKVQVYICIIIDVNSTFLYNIT